MFVYLFFPSLSLSHLISPSEFPMKISAVVFYLSLSLSLSLPFCPLSPIFFHLTFFSFSLWLFILWHLSFWDCFLSPSLQISSFTSVPSDLSLLFRASSPRHWLSELELLTWLIFQILYAQSSSLSHFLSPQDDFFSLDNHSLFFITSKLLFSNFSNFVPLYYLFFNSNCTLLHHTKATLKSSLTQTFREKQHFQMIVIWRISFFLSSSPTPNSLSHLHFLLSWL